MVAPTPVRESLREIDANTWLLGDRLVISRSSIAIRGYLWSDSGSFYSVSEVAGTPPASRPLPTTSSIPIRLVYDAGDASAVWAFGSAAFIKAKISEFPSTTREHVTLAWLKKNPPSFRVPDVFYHAEWAGRFYLILSRVPGTTISDAWPTIDEATKCHYVDQAVGICNELAKRQSDRIGGVDKNQLADVWLTKGGGTRDLSHENLLKSCTEIGLDCSSFVFFHCDMGPGNLIVDSDGSLGVIDWEIAGFVPKDWIRTKFRFADGLNLPGDDDERFDWRRRVQRRLGAEGYRDAVNELVAWWSE